MSRDRRVSLLSLLSVLKKTDGVCALSHTGYGFLHSLLQRFFDLLR